jgi:hypothetical protein
MNLWAGNGLNFVQPEERESKSQVVGDLVAGSRTGKFSNRYVLKWRVMNPDKMKIFLIFEGRSNLRADMVGMMR